MNPTTLSPRKLPRQERARATVEAILQAAAYILEHEGWDSFTTNRVAEKAGVNIASLYQYFPNKSALVEELRHRHIEEAQAALRTASAESRDPLAAMVRALIAAHRVSPALHRIFSEELPNRTAEPSSDGVSDPELMDRLRPFLAKLPDPDLTMFVTRSAIHAVIHDAVCHRPEILQHRGFEEELTRLLRACLMVRNRKRTNARATC